MSVRKVHNSWWTDFRFAGIRYRKRSPENSQAGAKAYELLLRQRLSRGEPIDGGKEKAVKIIPLFKTFSDQWFTTYVQTNNKPSEQSSKRTTLAKHLIPSFGQLKLNEISGIKIEGYKAEKLKDGLSPKTINNHLTILSKCLHVAEEWIDFQFKPNIKFLKVPPQKFDFLSVEECQALLKTIDNPMWYTMVFVALRTGLRCGELAGLEWNNVNMEKRILTVRHSMVRGVMGAPKNNRERHIPITVTVCDALRQIRGRGELVFSQRDGRPLYHDTPIRTLHRYCKKANLRLIGWHTLRHTFASQLVANGVSIKAVQELLGHSDIRTTMRYAHLGPMALREAVEVLESSGDKKSGQQAVNTREVEFHPETKKALNLEPFPQIRVAERMGFEPRPRMLI